MSLETLVLVTRPTRLDGLVQRFNTRAQAKFYLEHAGHDFAEVQREHDVYAAALEMALRHCEALGLKLQRLDRALLPTYLFAHTDVVVALGPDGLVANAAKYVGAQPLVGVNPDPAVNDGVLLPWRVETLSLAVRGVLEDRATVREVTLAEARLSDGQRLLAFNDLFIGMGTHVSARYRLNAGSGLETQSSSGLLVSTGAGSTGWLSSVATMVQGAQALFGEVRAKPLRLEWESPRLAWVVREPYVSKHSSARQVAGWLEPGAALKVESLMPAGGVVFSDGMEADAMRFTSGLTATIRAADQRARLVVPRA